MAPISALAFELAHSNLDQNNQRKQENLAEGNLKKQQ